MNQRVKKRKALNCFGRTLHDRTSPEISEVATQLELLYNNSINMISECRYIYEEDKKTKELKEVFNKNYMKPMPAYHKGYKLFSNSHLPEKITVFGVGQRTQDIYNADILKNYD